MDFHNTLDKLLIIIKESGTDSYLSNYKDLHDRIKSRIKRDNINKLEIERRKFDLQKKLLSAKKERSNQLKYKQKLDKLNSG